MMLSKFSRLLFCLLLLTSSAMAWWDGGHKAISLIAYERLTAVEREWVVKMLEAHPTWVELFQGPMDEELGKTPDAETRARWIFAQASIWCDLIRKREGYPNAQRINQEFHRSSWHYTDLPVFPDDEARKELKHKDHLPPMEWTPGMPEPKPEGFNSMHTLQRVMHELPRATATAAEKAVSICWLFHVLGDTHQPCHCAELFVPKKLADGDRGANRVLVLNIRRSNPELDADVLHFFWDSLWNTDRNDLAAVQGRVDALRGDEMLWKRTETLANELDPKAWLREGHALAVSHIYSPTLLDRMKGVEPRPNPGPGKPEDVLMVSLPTAAMDEYVTNAKKLAREQVALAGVRLAEVLKRIVAGK